MALKNQLSKGKLWSFEEIIATKHFSFQINMKFSVIKMQIKKGFVK